MKPYLAYKDSGVEWLGEVPVGWEVRSIRSLAKGEKCSFIDGDWIESPFITDEGIRLIQTGNIGVGSYKEQGFRFISEETFDLLKCTEVEPRDVLICRLAEPVGRACLAPDLGVRMVTSVDVAVLKAAPDVIADYLVYLLSSPDYLSYMESQCRGGTRDRVSRSFLGGVRLPLPPLPEQQAIATFLDRETAKIDGLIEEQRRLIALLAEKRQATISHAVTRGLNPSARLKPSGVDWLGNIPEGWEVVRVKAVATCNDEVLAEGSDPLTDIEYVEISGVDANDGIVETTETTFGAAPSRARRIVRDGDVLISTVRTYLRAIAQVAEAAPNLVASTGFAVLRPKSVLSSFLGQVCRSEYFIAEVIARSVGVSYPAINASQIMALPVPLPPVHEQQTIAAFLDRETAKIDALTETATTAITLLQERRAALISAAVTGKIDVREVAKVPAQASQSLHVSAMVAGVIIARHGQHLGFGRMMVQKFLFMTQVCANAPEIGGDYERQAAGPLDRDLQNRVEADLEAAGLVRVQQEGGRGSRVQYEFLGDSTALRAELSAALGDRMERFDYLSSQLGGLTKNGIEAVATLYAAWNDFLIDGRTPDRADIIREVLENWHPEKSKKFTAYELGTWLDWMERQNIVPDGTGPQTQTGRLFP